MRPTRRKNLPMSKPLKSQKLRYSAKGKQCTMNVANVCNYDPATVVLAHVNCEGGSIGGKTDDYSACFACCDCHTWLDTNAGSEIDRLFYTRRGMVRTWREWINDELICLK